MRRLWPLTVRGTGALILAIACFVVAGEIVVLELTYFGILLLAVLGASVGSLYLARRTRVVTRSLTPDVATVGRETHVTVARRRPHRRTHSPGRVARHPAEGPVGRRRTASSRRSASGLRGSESFVESRTTVRGAKRGIHSIGPLIGDARPTPSGSRAAARSFGERTPVTVAPAIVELPPLIEFAGEAGGSLHTSTNQLGQGADNLVARPYVPGDSMRRIHWRATAHRDQLMVRQEEQESTPEASVVLDRGVLRWSREAMSAPGADPGFEAGVSACVSVVARLVQTGTPSR